MSAQKTISNSFTVTTMEDPVSVQAQYAPNNNPTAGQIHNVWQDGDLYMRTRETDSNVWSSWHKIVGESGGETDYTFGISAYKTTANASTAPSDITSWADAPMAVTSSKPYLWAKVQQKSWNASTQSYDVDSTRYIRLTGEDGASVLAQYAPNDNPSSSQIHDTWQSGDLYMRTKSTSDSSWSSWHKIVGESGDETDFTFNISKNKTSSSATTAPSDCYYQNWQDAPVAPTSTYPYLWMKIIEKTWNASTQSYDSGTARYARVTGETGDSAPVAFANPDKISIPCGTSGSVSSSLTQSVIFSLKVGTNAATVTGVTAGTKPTGVTVQGQADNVVTITIATTATASGLAAGVTFTVTGTYNSKTYSANITVALIGAVKGNQGDSITGPRGKMGRIYYYAQEWSNSSSVSYQVTDAEAPYFLYNGNYWVFNPEDNGTYTMAAMGTPSSSNTNWKMMVTDFKYIITEAIFGSFAHFGSAIISGDWLMSTNGYINGTAFNNTNISGGIVGGSSFSVKAYTLFDENYPLGDNTTIHESSDTTSVASSSTSVTRASSIYLTAGYTYCLVCSGYTSNASHPVYVRIQDSSGNYTVPVNLNSTSAVQRSGYFRVASSGYYSIVLTQDSGYTGTVTYSKIARVRFAPNYCVDLLTGKSYQNDAYIKGQIVATSGSIDSVSATNLTIKSGTITGDVTVGSGSVQIKLQPLGSGTSVGASIKAYDGTLVPFSLSFDRYYYGGTYAPHATLKLESVYPYSSQCGSVTLTDRTTERVLYYGSSQTPDSTYRTYDGYRSITNFSGMVRELSVNNTYYLRMGITATGVAAIIASAWPTSSDKSSLPTGCIYRDGENLKVKT